MKTELVGEAVVEMGRYDVRGRRLAGQRERERLLAAYDASGLTQAAFARREGIRYYTLIDWLRQRRWGGVSPVVGERGKPAGFVEVKLPGSGYGVEVVLPGGVVVRAQRAEEAVACVRGLR